MPYLGAKRYTTRVELGDGAYATFRKLTTGESHELAAAQAGDKDAAAQARDSVDLTAKLLVDWNLCDENDKLVPLDDHEAVVATILDLGIDTAQTLFEAIVKSISGRSGEDAERFQGAGEGGAEGSPAQELPAVAVVAD